MPTTPPRTTRAPPAIPERWRHLPIPRIHFELILGRILEINKDRDHLQVWIATPEGPETAITLAGNIPLRVGQDIGILAGNRLVIACRNFHSNDIHTVTAPHTYASTKPQPGNGFLIGTFVGAFLLANLTLSYALATFQENASSGLVAGTLLPTTFFTIWLYSRRRKHIHQQNQQLLASVEYQIREALQILYSVQHTERTPTPAATHGFHIDLAPFFHTL